jgi:ketosteroid isomerase-like protein
MKTLFLSLAVLALVSFDSLRYNQSDEKQQINTTLDAWHKAAAEVNFKAYFGAMTDDAIYIGTDPTENWDMKAFQAFAKPYFDKGKTWNFKAMERHIYFEKSGKLAWFDELLDTQMKICRGSGVLVKIGKEWKIKHYVLSMTIPNDNTNEVVKIIAPIEDVLIQKWKTK